MVAPHPYTYDRGAQIMSNIRGSWGPPVRYLEKRGYMDEQPQRQMQPFIYARKRQNDASSHVQQDQRNLDSDGVSNTFAKMFSASKEDESKGQRSLADNGFNQHNDYLDEQYFGEKLLQRIKDKWNQFWHNDTTTTESTKDETNAIFATTYLPNKAVLRNAKGQNKNLSYLAGFDESPENEAPANDTLDATERTTNKSFKENEESAPSFHINESDVDYMRKYLNCAKRNRSTKGINNRGKFLN